MKTTRFGILLGSLFLLSLAAACGDDASSGGGGAGGTGGGAPGGSGGGGGEDTCDLDGDGHRSEACGGEDCNDRDDRVNPGAPEVCDGLVDENCSGEADEGCECRPGDRRACFGPGLEATTRNVGSCRDGEQLCGTDGRWAACAGAVEPAVDGPDCDGVDQDCDGTPDGGLTNECGGCGPVPQEICGNRIDDDCDGIVDPGNLCNVHCGGVDIANPVPASLACCFRDPDVAGVVGHPVGTSTTCVEHPGMASCAERPCLDLDADPSTICEKRQAGQRFLCGLANGGGQPIPSDACGFQTPCAFVDCDDRQDQPCYSGPPATLGVGACHGGRTDCALDPGMGERNWTTCEGEVLPAEELCGNRVDDDCDGLIDEEDGASGRRCATTGRCAAGAVELCGDGQDDDCDGFADEGCRATTDTQACYAGPLGSRNLGVCHDGVQQNTGGFWGPCDGQVLPSPERCGDGVDSDCDGLGQAGAGEDDGCCVPTEGGEVCNGVDDDCDGLADEGVMSACGTCGEPCFNQEFAEPASCTEGSGRTCDRVEADPNDPDAFTLDDDKRSCGVAGAIYIAVQGVNEIAKLDTFTGQKIWQVPSHGSDPSRTAIACDGSVWFGNRGFQNDRDPMFSNAVHMDMDGNVLCIAPISGLVRGVALDANGYAWIGTYNTNRVYKVSGSNTAGEFNGFPACEIVDLAPNDPNEEGLVVGVPIYGLAIDQRGILWTGSGPTARIDTNTLTYELIQHSDSYGIAIDGQNNVWFGGSSGIHRLNADPPYLNIGQYQLMSNATGVYTVTVASDGAIWGTDLGGNRIVRLDVNTMNHQQWNIPNGFGSSPHGIAEDEYGKIWTPLMSGGYAFRFDPVTQQFTEFEVDAGMGLYTYSDMTGTQLRSFVARQGSWTQVWDSLYPNTDWRSLTWSQRVPPGSRVEVFVRFANSRNGLNATPYVCGPYNEPPVDLDACAGIDNNRYAAVEFILRPNQDGGAPTVGDIALQFTRP